MILTENFSTEQNLPLTSQMRAKFKMKVPDYAFQVTVQFMIHNLLSYNLEPQSCGGFHALTVTDVRQTVTHDHERSFTIRNH